MFTKETTAAAAREGGQDPDRGVEGGRVGHGQGHIRQGGMETGSSGGGAMKGTTETDREALADHTGRRYGVACIFLGGRGSAAGTCFGSSRLEPS